MWNRRGPQDPEFDGHFEAVSPAQLARLCTASSAFTCHPGRESKQQQTHISVDVFTLCFDWVTKLCFRGFFFPSINTQMLSTLTTKLICAHKLVNYVNFKSQNSVSLALPLSSLGS